MRDISAEHGWKLPKSCSRRRGSSYTLMVCRGKGDGEGSSDVSDSRIPSVVSRVLRYGDVKRVRADYGASRNIRGQRIHPHTKLIVMLAVVGGLLTLAFVAVASDKS